MKAGLGNLLRKLFFSRTVIFLVGFSLSFGAILAKRSYVISPAEGHFRFGWEMGRVAMSLASGHGYSSPLPLPTGPTAIVLPAYPLLMALVFKQFGIYTAKSALALLFLNCFFSGLTAIVLFELGTIVLTSSVGALAGWAWALYPLAVQVNGADIWETSLTTLLLATMLLAAFRLRPTSGGASWLGFGALCALAALSNSSSLLVSLILWGWICWRFSRQAMVWLKPIALVVLGFVLLMSPWWVRNYVTLGRFIPLRTNFWLEVWNGNCFDGVIPGGGSPEDYFATFEYHSAQVWANDRIYPNSAHPGNQKRQFEEFAQLGELRYMVAKRADSLRCITSNPMKFVELVARRFVFTWTSALYVMPNLAGKSRILLPIWVVWVAAYTSLSILAFLGAVFLWRISSERAVPFALLLYLYPLVYCVTHQSLHFRYPIDPEIILLAAISVHLGIRKLRSSRPAEIQLAAG